MATDINAITTKTVYAYDASEQRIVSLSLHERVLQVSKRLQESGDKLFASEYYADAISEYKYAMIPLLTNIVEPGLWVQNLNRYLLLCGYNFKQKASIIIFLALISYCNSIAKSYIRLGNFTEVPNIYSFHEFLPSNILSKGYRLVDGS